MSSSLTGGTKIEMMERQEIIDFLRESLSIEISMDTHYESRGAYLNTRVSISLDGEEIVSDDASILIED